MSPLNFQYIRPQTLDEAVRQYDSFRNARREPMYYAGGTEIITMGRLQQINPDAVIDIKEIPQTQVLTLADKVLRTGAALTLTQLTDTKLIRNGFPLLSVTANEIADRTARNKITLGGNVSGRIFYREAALPLLVSDSQVRVATRDGLYTMSMMDYSNEVLRGGRGMLLMDIATEETARKAPFVHIKRRKFGHVGYPIVTGVGIRVGDAVRVAFSGVFAYPFRSHRVEHILNLRDYPVADRVEQAMTVLSKEQVLDDFEASKAYRLFVLKQVMQEILQKLGG